jgi:hypothetical protein
MKRFWEKVRKTSGCWIWKAARTGAGYGSFRLDGRMQTAHRVAYEQVKGPIPEGMVLDHLCRNRACVNPDHLEVVSVGENTRRGDAGGAAQRRRTHCPKDHPYVGENLRVSNGRRHCRTCNRERMRARRAQEALCTHK